MGGWHHAAVAAAVIPLLNDASNSQEYVSYRMSSVVLEITYDVIAIRDTFCNIIWSSSWNETSRVR